MKKFKLFFRNWIGGQKNTLALVPGSEPEHVRATFLRNWISLQKPEQHYGPDIPTVLLSPETTESNIDRRRS